MNKKFIWIFVIFLTFFISSCDSVIIEDPLDVNVTNNQSNPASVYNENKWESSVSLGEIEGFEYNIKFCNNPDVGSTDEVIWDVGGNYVFLNVGERLEVVSDDNDDNGYTNSTGAWDIILFGLDDDYKEINEYLILNGTTSVITQQEFLRINRAFVIHSGTPAPVLDSNEGFITITSVNTTTVQAGIQEYNGQTEMCVLTVPANKTILITSLTVSTSEGRSIVYKTRARNCFGSQCTFTTKFSAQLYQNIFMSNFEAPLVVPEKTDIVSTAISILPGTTSVSALADYYLVDNSVIS